MTYTNFPNGITSLGVPVVGGINGIPLTGSWFFVDYANGSDGNGSASQRTSTGGNVGGATPEAPMKTISAAFDLCLSGNNDVIVIMGDGSTSATQRLSEQLVWSKNATHLIGITAPSMVAQRARISTASDATTNIANLVNVTAQGCIFSNFSLFQGVGEAATAEQLWQEAGQRNYYGNVAFGGMGSANGAGVATSYSLKLYGGSENLFDGCYFGTDTQDRSAANTNVLIRKNASNVASTRNVFRNCLFAMRASAATPTFIDGNESGGTDRFNLFKNCTFTNFGTAIAAVVAFHASQGGYTIMDNCTAVNCTDWTASDTAVVQIAGPVPNGDTSGMAVPSDAT
jgi:hypothetical protein